VTILARRLAVAVAVVAGLVAADLASKRWAASDLKRGGPRELIPNHLTLVYRENPGAVLGLLADAPPPVRSAVLIGLSALAGAVTLTLLSLRLRHPAPGLVLPAGLATLLAGTIGNLHDRLRRGFVVDFIEWWVAGRFRWPTFNVADAEIAAGLALCALAAASTAYRRSKLARLT